MEKEELKDKINNEFKTKRNNPNPASMNNGNLFITGNEKVEIDFENYKAKFPLLGKNIKFINSEDQCIYKELVKLIKENGFDYTWIDNKTIKVIS